jgi:uncharacterized protein (DUF169 family)
MSKLAVNTELAAQLSRDLELDIPPVALVFSETKPEGFRAFDKGVPSWCTFWGEARTDSFYAPISGHDSCEIGAFVLGMPLDGKLGTRLNETLGWMQGEGYLAKGEEGGIPHLGSAPKFVAYGPLRDMTLPPSVVVFFARPSSAMIVAEASSPGAAHPFGLTMSGRPAYAVIPTVLTGKAPVAMSLGCSGFRAYVEPGNDKLLIAVRGDHLPEFASAVHALTVANSKVTQEMVRRKSTFDA